MLILMTNVDPKRLVVSHVQGGRDPAIRRGSLPPQPGGNLDLPSRFFGVPLNVRLRLGPFLKRGIERPPPEGFFDVPQLIAGNPCRHRQMGLFQSDRFPPNGRDGWRDDVRIWAIASGRPSYARPPYTQIMVCQLTFFGLTPSGGRRSCVGLQLRLLEILGLGFRAAAKLDAIGAGPEPDAVGIVRQAAALQLTGNGQTSQRAEQRVARSCLKKLPAIERIGGFHDTFLERKRRTILR